ncbi:hypothetical protein Pelo_15454 [Pelomyxa schiedti]|nr:hypothetical protein Pelo_15454 [Pelomyxa schiedti]
MPFYALLSMPQVCSSLTAGLCATSLATPSENDPIPATEQQPEATHVTLEVGPQPQRRRTHRTSLTKQCLTPLRAWALEHVDNLYPTKEDKAYLAMMSGLTEKQVHNWYSNLRKRVIRPLQNELS